MSDWTTTGVVYHMGQLPIEFLQYILPPSFSYIATNRRSCGNSNSDMSLIIALLEKSTDAASYYS